MTKLSLIVSSALIAFCGVAGHAATVTSDLALPTEPNFVTFGSAYSQAPDAADTTYSIQTYSLVYVLAVFDVQTVIMGPTDSIDDNGPRFALAPQGALPSGAVAAVPLPAALPLLGAALLAFAGVALRGTRAHNG